MEVKRMSVKDWIDEVDKKPKKELKINHVHIPQGNVPTCAWCRGTLAIQQREKIIELLKALVEK